MKFSICFEAQMVDTSPESEQRTFYEAVEQTEYAEKMGFDAVWAVEHHALPADNATRLVELFTEARFSAHLMTERDRADAIVALRRVLDELRNP